MEPSRRVQIHQYNDPEILEFFNTHRVRYRVVGDHLFIVRSCGHDVAAGPGDWLGTGPDGEVEVQPGGYAGRARRAILRAGQMQGNVPGGSDGVLETSVEAEARARLKRSVRHVVHSD